MPRLARQLLVTVVLAVCACVPAAGDVAAAKPAATATAKKQPTKKRCATAARKVVKRTATKRCKATPKRAPVKNRAAKKPAAKRAAPAPPRATPAPSAAPAPAPSAAAPAIPAPPALSAAKTPVVPATPATAVAPASPAAPKPTARDPRPFAQTSFWNAPLADDAPIDARSDDYVADLGRQLDQWLPWVNTTKFSSPVYEVPAGQPTVRVRLEQSNAALQRAWENVPIPPDAVPAAGSDRTMVVYQPSTDTMWEFWLATKDSSGWRARWGGRMTNVSKSSGRYEDPTNWGATASSLPMLGGLIRLDEVRAGRIDHALALAIPEVRAGWYSWPAQRTDGTVTRTTAPPEGARFRIDPDLDLAKLKLAPFTRMVAEAAQKYGIVLRDKAGSVAFYGEDPTPSGSDAFTRAFGGAYPSKLLASFPWAHLQVLRTDLRQEP
jgi:hypothetical protein